MGYVNDTHTCYYIPPTLAHRVTGTWSNAAGQVADTIVESVNDANQTSKLTIPIVVPSNSSDAKGFKLTSIEIDYEVTGAALEEVTAVVNKVTRGAEGAVAVVAAQAFSYDTGHDAANERNTQDEHVMTLTLTTPVWVEDDHVIQVQLTNVAGAGGGVFDFIGMRANYTYRL